MEIDQESSVRLHTANGIAGGKRGRAKSIQLRSLLAKDVPVVVQADRIAESHRQTPKHHAGGVDTHILTWGLEEDDSARRPDDL